MKYIKNLKMCYKKISLLTFLYCPKLKLLEKKTHTKILYSIIYNKSDFVTSKIKKMKRTKPCYRKKLLVHKLCFSVLNYFRLF